MATLLERLERKIDYLPTELVMLIQSFLSIETLPGQQLIHDPWTLTWIELSNDIRNIWAHDALEMYFTEQIKFFKMGNELKNEMKKVYHELTEREEELKEKFGLSCVMSRGTHIFLMNTEGTWFASIAPGIWHDSYFTCECADDDVGYVSWEYHVDGINNKDPGCEECADTRAWISETLAYLHEGVWELEWGKKVLQWFKNTQETTHIVQKKLAWRKKTLFLNVTFKLTNVHYEKAIIYKQLQHDIEPPLYFGLELIENEPSETLLNSISYSIRMIRDNKVLERDEFLKLGPSINHNAHAAVGKTEE